MGHGEVIGTVRLLGTVRLWGTVRLLGTVRLCLTRIIVLDFTLCSKGEWSDHHRVGDCTIALCDSCSNEDLVCNECHRLDAYTHSPRNQ